jgi:hypothetical protein
MANGAWAVKRRANLDGRTICQRPSSIGTSITATPCAAWALLTFKATLFEAPSLNAGMWPGAPLQSKIGADLRDTAKSAMPRPTSNIAMPLLPAPPALLPMTTLRIVVAPMMSLGAVPYGERRFVPLGSGTAIGPELSGTIVAGGIDWQTMRADGVLDIAAHYVIRTEDGALVEVTSTGLRHGPAKVMGRLARGEAVPREAYFFRTLMRFQTGAPPWLHLNRVMAIAVGEREANEVRLDVYRLT